MKYKDIDLFGKRPSEIETEIYKLKRRIEKLEDDRRYFAGITVSEKSEKLQLTFMKF